MQQRSIVALSSCPCTHARVRVLGLGKQLPAYKPCFRTIQHYSPRTLRLRAENESKSSSVTPPSNPEHITEASQSTSATPKAEEQHSASGGSTQQQASAVHSSDEWGTADSIPADDWSPPPQKGISEPDKSGGHFAMQLYSAVFLAIKW